MSGEDSAYGKKLTVIVRGNEIVLRKVGSPNLLAPASKIAEAAEKEGIDIERLMGRWSSGREEDSLRYKHWCRFSSTKLSKEFAELIRNEKVEFNGDDHLEAQKSLEARTWTHSENFSLMSSSS